MPAPRATKATDFYTLPDPDTLSPAQAKALWDQPWFRRAAELDEAGVALTNEFVRDLAAQPGAMGLHVQELDLGEGRKARVVLDRSTGKPLNDTALNIPFQPKIETLADPATGKNIAVLRETPSSVRQLKDDKQTAGGIDLQPFKVNGKKVGFFYRDEEGKPKQFEIPKDQLSGKILPEWQALLDSKDDDAVTVAPVAKPGAAVPAAKAPEAAAPMKPAAAPAAAPAGRPAALTLPEREKVQVGEVYRGPDGQFYRRKK